jgi:hypothetical protein
VLGGPAAVRLQQLGPIAHPEDTSLQPTMWELAKEAARRDGAGELNGHARQLFGDAVARFSETAAAAGALGRFPGSEVMRLLKQFVGREQAADGDPADA